MQCRLVATTGPRAGEVVAEGTVNELAALWRAWVGQPEAAETYEVRAVEDDAVVLVLTP